MRFWGDCNFFLTSSELQVRPLFVRVREAGRPQEAHCRRSQVRKTRES